MILAIFLKIVFSKKDLLLAWFETEIHQPTVSMILAGCIQKNITKTQ
jgi:hypothetical protein